MFYVYAIRSASRNYIYVGLTDDLERRLHQHNSGLNRTTRPYAPFTLIWSESFPTRQQARQREKYLKSGVGKEFLKSLLPETSYETSQRR
jgi:putative endonuclease